MKISPEFLRHIYDWMLKQPWVILPHGDRSGMIQYSHRLLPFVMKVVGSDRKDVLEIEIHPGLGDGTFWDGSIGQDRRFFSRVCAPQIIVLEGEKWLLEYKILTNKAQEAAILKVETEKYMIFVGDEEAFEGDIMTFKMLT